MMEDLIDKAQRYKLKPDVLLEQEIAELTALRDQTFKDLQEFVQNREKSHWRNWDKFKVVQKQPKSQIKIAKLQVSTAKSRVKNIEIDSACLTGLNTSMINFVATVLGKGWDQKKKVVQVQSNENMS